MHSYICRRSNLSPHSIVLPVVAVLLVDTSSNIHLLNSLSRHITIVPPVYGSSTTPEPLAVWTHVGRRCVMYNTHVLQTGQSGDGL